MMDITKKWTGHRKEWGDRFIPNLRFSLKKDYFGRKENPEEQGWIIQLCLTYPESIL